ncbi:tumor necrosis factor, alpha-induced protein 8-like protein 2 B [Hemiscyllium ocellatum]|uniref:tumor necrosis factor, alpha-induced protein 8-like protein 2 B n=1 Tax=Hemiscyllium ocellatum TaxID=170820 RepID=UPI0029672032|nr:tumor necrosis factor, alpha-induced protein 8-like protein 2 B [Hemiscyllium ocellatum]XP_060678315.1 tumor necrosis factor, alpha-induced protein 8-like protein 2 B [Hemiscyllium ocellatum]XP_060678316.1 tumor necrosis factor, alpha-induced protein 8-like protein 2 B [Hemiscyllium ocellatum]XP_060678317.1 tumor necrosis factor, alpha-induced protein 8-like protein 2 B [Hemiscyllium ocellatum]
MEPVSSKDLAMKAQKKILSRLANKSLAQLLIDDTSAEILDELYRVSKQFTGNRAESQKVLKNLVKVAVKIGVLFRHRQFSESELGLAAEFRRKLRQGAMTAISFREVAFTFEAPVLTALLRESRDLLLRLVEGHLTAKSLGRIRHVFDHFGDGQLLSQLYGEQDPYRAHLQKICDGLGKLLEDGTL